MFLAMLGSNSPINPAAKCLQAAVPKAVQLFYKPRSHAAIVHCSLQIICTAYLYKQTSYISNHVKSVVLEKVQLQNFQHVYKF